MVTRCIQDVEFIHPGTLPAGHPSVTVDSFIPSRCICDSGACRHTCLHTPLDRKYASQLDMKRFLRKLREKITFKDLPPPYRESDSDDNGQRSQQELQNSINAAPCEVLDLLVNCKITYQDKEEQSDVEYAEIKEMGLWHSTPLAKRHKSKISLTWVLKENLENNKSPQKIQTDDKPRKINGNDVDRQQRHNQKFNEVNQVKCNSGEVKNRVMGRNEYYHNYRFKSACDEFVNGQNTCSDTSVGTEEYMRRKHRHRHRRKKKHQSDKFGYDIRDLDSFLSEASIDRPGNIPVVVAYPTTLYQTQKDKQRELTLPLGTVVNAVFKNQLWLYVQTPHGEEGYVLYSACLPLGILPNRTPERKTPCWESSTDIYPRPCGNLTDIEKEQLRGRTRSECQYRPRNEKKLKNLCAEKNFDSLYLRTKSVCSNIDRVPDVENIKELTVKRQTLLVVTSDYRGSDLNKTLSVQQGDVVTLVQGKGVEADGSVDWFYVKKRDGSHGFIPAAIAGHGYI
ncbi:LOW QUALITY PROTEIN: uncharacterized protein LOC131850692 [Achroia grisella]|uniref:LOW QUALITY PROTEIN: uncharacterized protein LOC131850692 n=1 Tax=Achroia grisella TaxID=688607 RepID=UPI0027D2B7E6|nr:LOW QUALITY PROTEIN: uncharacterized protein LOC131850692 [Achroia grisella]